MSKITNMIKRREKEMDWYTARGFDYSSHMKRYCVIQSGIDLLSDGFDDQFLVELEAAKDLRAEQWPLI